MKEFWTKIKSTLYDLFIASNRYIHLMLGWGIFIVMAFAIGLSQGLAINAASVIIGSYVATLLVMIGVEIKDKVKGGVFDWKDINAGMFLGNLILILWLILSSI